MAQVTAVPIGADRVTTDDEIVVASPYDGSEVGRVPSCGAARVGAPCRRRRPGRAAGARPRGARPGRGAGRAPGGLRPHRRGRGRQAPEDGPGGGGPGRRHVPVAREARTLAGDVVPVEAAPGEGKLAFTLRVPIGVVGAISPFNFPLNLVAHKVAPAIAAGCRWCSSRRAGPCRRWPGPPAARRVRPAGGVAQRGDGVGRRGGRPAGDPRRRHGHLHRRPRWGGRSARRCPARRSASSWATTARSYRGRRGLAAAVAKLKVAGFSHAGQSCISSQRVLVPLDPRRPGRRVGGGGRLAGGQPALDEDTDVSALISRDETERVKAWIDEAVGAGAKVAVGGDTTGDGILRPTVLTGVSPDMQVCRDEVFGPVLAVAAYDTVDEAIALANDTRYGLQAGIFTARIDVALGAARRLDFGGVLVNEVPTWRADQQPYGGLRDSGNTREARHYLPAGRPSRSWSSWADPGRYSTPWRPLPAAVASARRWRVSSGRAGHRR